MCTWPRPPAWGLCPGRCAVVEDTVPGVTAGVAAGAVVFGYSPPEAGHDVPDALRRAGAAVIFGDMAQLPKLLEARPPQGAVRPSGRA